MIRHSRFTIAGPMTIILVLASAPVLAAGSDSAKGTLTVWQYAVRKAANGELEQAPRMKIGLFAHDSLRVEPYATPLKVIAHE